MVVVDAMVMQIPVMSLMRKVQLGFWHACVVIIRLAFIAMSAKQDMNRKNGDKIQKHVHSNANVRQSFLSFWTERSWKHFSHFIFETACNCHGHSNTCQYDEETDRQGLSLDIHGRYEGGGVCQNCQHNTEGINCDKCQPKYYRPYGKHWNETDVCRRKQFTGHNVQFRI